MVHELYNVFMGKKLKVNAGKRRQLVTINVDTPYRVSVPVKGRYEVVLRGEKIEEVKEFKYLGKLLSKHEKMEK